MARRRRFGRLDQAGEVLGAKVRVLPEIRQDLTQLVGGQAQPPLGRWVGGAVRAAGRKNALVKILREKEAAFITLPAEEEKKKEEKGN